MDMDFEDFLTSRNDETYNAAYDLLNVIVRATEDKAKAACGKSIAWDMEIIGNLVDYAKVQLSKHGYNTCHPFYEGENRTPCIKGEDCDKVSCPFRPNR